jgi:hypothetical protein
MILLFTGKRLAKIPVESFFSYWTYIYVTIYDVEEGVLFLQNEFPCVKMSPFDPEFDSASNGDTFIHGKTIGKNFTFIFVLSPIHVYVTIYDVQGGFSVLRTNSR